MVSFWPWRVDETSPASFEKALSTLSTKISKYQVQLDQLRQNSRRFRALWTLYTSFAYLLCVIILALVVGWRNWSAFEYGAITGSPLLIYLVRTASTTYYTYRIDAITYRLEELQSERSKTIDKLKTATKYNKTQQLLEQYGGASTPKPKRSTSPTKLAKKSQKHPGRTSLGPPATANIPSRSQIPNSPFPALPPAIQQLSSSVFINRSPPSTPSSPVSHSEPGPPEFAPNAFVVAPQYDRSNESNTDGKWYDRLLDLLMGEDETAAKNRIALICQNCRLVNGQAPPGVRRLEELGKWRCSACHGWNGEALESKKIVDEIKEMTQTEEGSPSGAIEDKIGIESLSEEDVKAVAKTVPDDEDYEDIDENIHVQEEPTNRIRRRTTSDNTKL